MKLGPNQTKWLNDLELGIYKKGVWRLCSVSIDNKEEKYCCLGVACLTFGLRPETKMINSADEIYAKIFVSENESYQDYAPDEIVNVLSLKSETGQISGTEEEMEKFISDMMSNFPDLNILVNKSLSSINDATHAFEEVIYVIKNYPHLVFNESK